MSDAARELRIAGRALARAGLLHAYGHCSVRLDAASMLASPGKPLGLVAAGEPCTPVPLEGPLPGGLLGELRVHVAIYRARPDVHAIARAMPPQVMALSAFGQVPRARHGFGAYHYPAPAFWDDPQLLRDEARSAAAAAQLGTAQALVMRGNGAVVVGASLREAVVLTWYLEDMARIECLGRSMGLDAQPPLSAEAAHARATWGGGILERMWAYLTHGDPEAER
jgi:HCOMODA/2-hydroxy-3-carboxy-muconic semialdehyde decarboxylase